MIFHRKTPAPKPNADRAWKLRFAWWPLLLSDERYGDGSRVRTFLWWEEYDYRRFFDRDRPYSECDTGYVIEYRMPTTGNVYTFLEQDEGFNHR